MSSTMTAYGEGTHGLNLALRATGVLTLPETGTYLIGAYTEDGVRLYLDDVLRVDMWVDGGWRPAANATYQGVAGQQIRVRYEYYQGDDGRSATVMTWRTPSGVQQTIPGQYLTPDYGLVTSTANLDDGPGTAAPNQKSATEYAKPWLGMATATINDPDGQALREETRYEEPGAGYLRRTGLMLPGPVAAKKSYESAGTTYSYYKDKETIGQAWGGPVCGLPADTIQPGLLRSTQSPTPAVGEKTVADVVYDAWGRTAGTRVSGNTGWTCTTFDERGRTTKTVTAKAAEGNFPERVTTTDYAHGGDPFVTAGTDSYLVGKTTTDGVTTARTDLLGRSVSSTDMWGTTSVFTYDKAGKVTATTTTTSAGVVFSSTPTYDADGRVVQAVENGVVLAEAVYDGVDLGSVKYANGTSVSSAKDMFGHVNELGTQLADRAIVEKLTYSRSGSVLATDITDSSNGLHGKSSYNYDWTGNLMAAVFPGHQQFFTYDGDAELGTNSGAGLSGNRTMVTDQITSGDRAGEESQTYYGYDMADRLTSVASNGFKGERAGPLDGDVLEGEILYDSRGNTTVVPGIKFGYDTADQHISTIAVDGSRVEYLRDSGGEIVERTATSKDGTVLTTRYTASGVVLDEGNAVLERVLALVGGVLLTDRTGGQTSTVWSYPNAHGDIVMTADSDGVATSGLVFYDPFGQVVAVEDYVSGVEEAFAALPENLTAGSNGWVGKNDKLTEMHALT